MLSNFKNRTLLTIMVMSFCIFVTMIEELRANEVKRGQVTDLPLPRFVSISANKANARRGPSLTHRIDWVYRRRHLPVVITAEHEHWRRIIDQDGVGGWIHYSLLSGRRTAVVNSTNAPMRVSPDLEAAKIAILEQRVVAEIGECNHEWCWLETNGYEGWVAVDRLWGVKLPQD